MTFSITFFHDELCFSGFYSGSLCRNLMGNGRNRPNIYHESLTFSLMGGSVASSVCLSFFSTPCSPLANVNYNHQTLLLKVKITTF